MTTTPTAPTAAQTPPGRGEQRADPRWWHPLLAALWLAVLGAIPAWSGLSPWWMLLGLPVTLVARAAVDQWAPVHTYGHTHHHRARTFVLTAGASATAWLVYTGHTLTTAPARAAGLLAIWAAVTGTGYAWLRTRTPHRAATDHTTIPAREHTIDGRDRADDDTRPNIPPDAHEHRQRWDAWLAEAGLEGVTVNPVDGVRETLAGYTLVLTVGLNSKRKVAKFGELHNARETLAVLASHHYRQSGISISTRQLRPEATEQASTWLLHVDTKQPLKRSIPHPGDRGPATMADPFDIGIYEDGSPLAFRLLGVHGTMVGSTGSGKSVVLNNVVGEGTRRPDCRVCVAATAKLMPVIWPWLEPWLAGRTDRPVLHRVAGEDLKEVLLLLADLYKIAVLRNRRLGPLSKHVPTPEDPAYLAIFDEATNLATNTTEIVTTFDGREWTASALFDALCSMARSASMSLLFWTQYGLVDALGDYGTKVMRNLTLRIAGRTEKAYDGTATLSRIDNVDTTKLSDHQILVQPNAEQARALAAKAYELDGSNQIGPLAQAHTRYVRDDIPEWLADALGASHADRWQPWRQKHLVEACQRMGLIYPVPDQRPGQLPAAGDDDQDGGLPATPEPRRLAVVSDRPSHAQVSADLAAAHDQLKAALAQHRAEVEEYGPLGRVMTSVWRAFRAPNAPTQAEPWQVAVAAELVPADAPDPELDAVTAEVLRVLADYGVTPISADGADPVILRDDILRAWDTAKAELLAAEQARAAAADPVLAAVDGMDDGDWIGVARLGVAAGRIPEGDRGAAIAFGKELRGRGLPADAFRQVAAGSEVRVGALRHAARRAA